MTLKTIKVNEAAHEKLTELARERETTAGRALLALLNDDSVKVPLEPVQRKRWEQAAALQGVSLPQFILLRVEAQFSAVPPGVRDTHDVPLPATWGACCTPPATP